MAPELDCSAGNLSFSGIASKDLGPGSCSLRVSQHLILSLLR